MELGDGIRNFCSHFIRVGDIRHAEAFSRPFFQVEVHCPERKEIPELRFACYARDILDVHGSDAMVEERELVRDNDLVGGDEEKIKAPVEEGLKDGGKSKKYPCDDDRGGDPSRGNFPWKIDGAESYACGDQCDCEEDLIDDREKEEEAVTKNGENFPFVHGEKALFYPFNVGFKGEDAHSQCCGLARPTFSIALRVSHVINQTAPAILRPSRRSPSTGDGHHEVSNGHVAMLLR